MTSIFFGNERTKQLQEELFAHISDPPVGSEVAQSVVKMNKLFHYERFTIEGTAALIEEHKLLFPLAQRVWRLASEFITARKTCWLALTNKMAEYYLYEKRDYEHGENYLRFATIWCEMHPKEKVVYDHARALSNLGYLVWNHGFYKEARQHLDKAKFLYHSIENREFEIAFCENCLGLVDKTEKKYEAAIAHFEEGLRLARQRDGEEKHLHFTMLYHNLGVVYRLVGRLDDAKQSIEKAYNKNIQAYGTDERIEVPGNLHELGNVFLAMKNYPEAAKRYERSYEIRKKILSENHLDISASHHALAVVYKALNREQESQWRTEQRDAIYVALNLSAEDIEATTKRYCQ